MSDIIGNVLLTREEIENRAAEIGKQISEEYQGKEIVLACVLRGAVMWMADIMKNIKLDAAIDFIIASSYGASTESSGKVELKKDFSEDIRGRHVILVEDIVDTGITLNRIKEYTLSKGAESVTICTMLNKPSRRKVDVYVDYVGFEVEDKFLIGYGLDFDQRYRNLPYVSYIEE